MDIKCVGGRTFMSQDIFDPTIGALNTSLNLRQMNQNVIASNIANADTPGFKAKSVEFENAFRRALDMVHRLPVERDEETRTRPMDLVRPEIFEDPNGVESLDGNTVNRGAEMAKMAENQVLYDASVEMLKKKIAMLKYGITEGGGNR